MNNNEMKGRKSPYDSRRSSLNSTTKVYEQMLLKELPGNNRSNQPMHAVLESALDDDVQNDIEEAQKVRNHALIHYLASLANSNNYEDTFDFDFVDSLIQNGADINSTDKSGQTIFHEVARSWNLDVASFLIEHGANLNQQDKFGRSPLHVAAAVDYADMVRFLLKNGANINIKTDGEGQMPIHYAAKNDACKSLKMLLGYGADVDSRDSKNRTPLQVAAEMNRAKSSKLLIQHGAPAGVYDNTGNSALSLLIEKLPDVAVEALDQFHSVSTINRKEFFFLNYLEGNRLQNPKSPAYSALEIAVQNQEFDIILHPVMQRLILVKWQKFGRQGAIIDLGINLVYVILWTVIAVSSPAHGHDMYLPWSEKAWRLVLAIIVCLMTMDEIRKQLTGTLRTRNRQKKWIAWRATELEEDLMYCHPRWPQEEMYLKSEIKAIRDTPLISTGDSWIYFDWFSLFLILCTIASHLVFLQCDEHICHICYARTITMLLLVLWFRMLKYARPFEGAGPFVVIFGHIIQDIMNWGLLIIVIAVPFGCAFWITFGKGSREPVDSYSDFSSLFYNMFSMVVVNDHDFESLVNADATMARILCGSFIGIMAIINLNLLIALLSDTFTRVYGNAVANAVMQRAKTILILEKTLNSKKKKEYKEFIVNNGSPEAVELQRDISASSDRDDRKSSEMLKDRVKEMHSVIQERFGTQYGDGHKSDLDHIKESLTDMKESREQERHEVKKMRRRINQLQDILVKISDSLHVDVTNIARHSSTEDEIYLQGNEEDEQNFFEDESLNSESGNEEESNDIHLYNSRQFSAVEPAVDSFSKGVSNKGYFPDDRMEPRRQEGKQFRETPRPSSRGETRKTRIEERGGSRQSRRAHDEALEPTRREARDDSRNESRGVTPGKSRGMSSGESRGKSRGDSRKESQGEWRKESRNVVYIRSPRPTRKSLRERDPETSQLRAVFARDSGQSAVPNTPRPSRSANNREQTRRQEPRKTSNSNRRSKIDSEDPLGARLKRSGDDVKPVTTTRHPWNQSQYLSDKGENSKNLRSDSDDIETSESDVEEQSLRFQERPRDDDVNIVCSDNDMFRRRRSRSSARSSTGRQYYDNWDNRSIKSVAF